MYTLLLVSLSTSHIVKLLRKDVGLGAVGRTLPGNRSEGKLYLVELDEKLVAFLSWLWFQVIDQGSIDNKCQDISSPFFLIRLSPSIGLALWDRMTRERAKETSQYRSDINFMTKPKLFYKVFFYQSVSL